MKDELKKIIDRLYSEDAQVRKDAALALGEMENPAAIPELMKKVSDPNPAVRYFVKRSLGRIRKVHTPRHEEVRKSLKDKEKPDINLDALERYLNDKEYTKRLTAAKGALKIGSPLAVPFLLDRLEIEEHDFVKSALVKVIGTLGDEHIAERLVPFLKDPDSRVRANTIEGLEATGADILEYIVTCCNDGDNRVRGNALRILGQFDREQAIDKLADMCRNGDFSARLSAVYALGKLGPEEKVIELLKEALQASEAEVRELAGKALSELDIPVDEAAGGEPEEGIEAAGKPDAEVDGQLIEVDRSEIVIATSKVRWGQIFRYALLLVVVVGLTLSFPHLKKFYLYQRAKSDLSAGRYSEALKKLDEISGFKDSKALMRQAKLKKMLDKGRDQLDRSDMAGALTMLRKARSDFPDEPEIVSLMKETSRRLVMGAVEEEKYEAALRYRREFKKEFSAAADDLDRNLNDWFAARISTLDSKRDTETMLNILEQQVTFFPNDPEVPRQIAAVKIEYSRQLHGAGEVDKAYVILRELDVRFPGREDIKKLLKACEIRRATAGDDKTAGYRISELIDILDKYPNSHKVRVELVDLFLDQGLALDKQGEDEQAKRIFQRALEIAPNDERVLSAVNAQHLRYAREFLDKRRFREAERELNAVRTVTADLVKAAALHRNLSVGEVKEILKRNNLEMAGKRLETLHRRYREDPEIAALLRQVKIDLVKDLFNRGKYLEAIGKFEQLSREFPGETFDEEIRTAKLAIADDHFANGRYLEAYRLFKAVLAAKPDDRRALDGLKKSHFRAGQLYLKRFDYEKAMAEFETVLKLDRNHTAARAGLAEAYLNLAQGYLEAGRLTEARQQVEISLKVFPGNEEAVSLEQTIRVKEMEEQYRAVGNPYIRRQGTETSGTSSGTATGGPGPAISGASSGGTTGDWTVMFSAIDRSGDDRGDGSYVYPIHPAYEPGAFDILEFKVLVSDDQVAFRVRIKKDILKQYRPRSSESDERGQTVSLQTGDGGWIFQMFDIYIDTDNTAGSGRQTALPGRNVTFVPEDAWEKVVLVSPEGRSSMERTISHKSEIPGLADLRGSIALPNAVFLQRNTFEARVPIETIGRPSKGWKYQVLMMGYNSNDLPTSLRTIEVKAHADCEHFGGGTDYHGDSNVIDLLDPPGAAQYDMLANYVSGPNRQANRYPVIRMVKH